MRLYSRARWRTADPLERVLLDEIDLESEVGSLDNGDLEFVPLSLGLWFGYICVEFISCCYTVIYG